MNTLTPSLFRRLPGLSGLSRLVLGGLVLGLLSCLSVESVAQVKMPSAMLPQTELPQTELKVVGGLSTRLNYLEIEQPFWSKMLPERSAGRVTAQIKGFDTLGIKGPELLRLISQGVIEFGVVPISYYQSTMPWLEAVDIAGLVTSAPLAKDTVASFAPVLSHYLESAHQSKFLGVSPYAPQVLFCNRPVHQLSDLRGLTVRTVTRTQAELMEALGAKSVPLAFQEVLPALTDQSIACAISGSMAGYRAKWYQATTHLYVLPLGWNQEIHAVNQKAWDALDPTVQVFLEANVDTLIKSLWQFSESVAKRGNDCNVGSKECPTQPRGRMVLVQPTATDLLTLKRIAVEKILPQWAARCSDSCVTDFNQTIGKLLTVVAKK